MPRSAATAESDRLLHSSPQRTLFLCANAAGGPARVCKVFVTGSMADAEAEFTMGSACAGTGVVRYLEACVDPATSRPCVLTAFEDGIDLDRLVAEQGALPAAVACRLLAGTAETLATMHALALPDAPHGIAHGDVKPKNLLATPAATVLLDFEHAQPIRTGVAQGAAMPIGAGGEFVAPEVRLGAPPTGASDVFGLGMTLRWLLDGGGVTALPQHPDLVALVGACTATDPARRPDAEAVAAQLRILAVRLAADPEELLLDRISHGETTDDVEPPVATRAGLTRLWQRRQRLLRRLPRILEAPAAHPTEPGVLLREIRDAARVLQRFPRHVGAWKWRRELCLAAGRLAGNAAAQAGDLRRAEEFDAAVRWLDEARTLVRVAMALPGGCPIPHSGPATTVGLLHRDPLTYLQQLQEQVESARAELEGEVAAIRAAEATLDLDRAGRAVEAMARNYGGSSPTAARRRDQLHRLGFYVDRIARAHPNVERANILWDATALRPLVDFVAAATTANQRKGRSDAASGVVGLRSLQITLVNLAEEFPHVAGTAGALETLSHALGHLTDQSWDLVAEAERCLRSVPVPVRPLQVALSRLDTYRILESFVDRPGRPRSQLQDSLESLRLRLDQARATRDRLAEGAEQALARGHWTTGLFDMERAIANLNPIDERERDEAARLTARLAEARRRKREVETALQRNVELATRYSTLQDDPSSSFTDRLAVLGERRDCLRMLAAQAPAERAVLYGGDLREVDLQVATEQAAQAESELDRTVDPFERLRVARSTLELLHGSAGAQQLREPSGRMVRLLDHWRTLVEQSQRAVDAAQSEAHSVLAHNRRVWQVATIAALASASAILLALWPWLSGAPAHAAPTDRRAKQLEADIAELPMSLQRTAMQLIAVAHEPADGGSNFELDEWHERWSRALREFAAAATHTEASRVFAIACWDHALNAAQARLPEPARRRLSEATDALTTALQPLPWRPTVR